MSAATDTMSTKSQSSNHRKLPVGWHVKPLKAVSNIVRGSSPRPAGDPKYFHGNFIPWLTVASLTSIPDTQPIVNETVSGLTREGSNLSRRLEKGTLILANSGATLGVAKILGIDCCANDGIAAFIDWDEESVDKMYALYFLNSKTAYFRDIIAPGNGQPNLNTELIGSEDIIFPPLPEQQAIAACLGTWDRAIDAVQQLIAAKEERKKWLMQMLLTGKKRLKGFGGEWQDIRLGELGGFLKGAGISKDEAKSNGSPAIRYGELYTCYHYVIYETKTFIDSDSAAKSRRIQYGDILIASSGETKEEIGKCSAYLSEKTAYAGGDIIVYRPTSGHSGFLGYLLNSAEVNTQKRSFAKGHSVVHIYPKDMANIRITIPKTIEQNAIWQVFVIADRELELLQVKLDRLRDEKRGLMQGLLTGRKRLKVEEHV